MSLKLEQAASITSGTGPQVRKNVLAQIQKWLKAKYTRQEVVHALILAGYTRNKIEEYLEIAETEMNGHGQ